MKYIVFDISNILKDSIIGQAAITSNPLNIFRKDVHNNFVVLRTEDDITDCTLAARLIAGENLVLSTGKTIKVNVVKGNFIVFEPDGNFKTLRTGYVRQIEINKLKNENFR